MFHKILFITGFHLLIFTASYAQYTDKHWSAAAEGHALVAGELNTIYNALIGINAQYTLNPTNKFSPYFKAGAMTDAFKSNANLIGLDAQLGIRYQLTAKWSTQLGVGGIYWEDTFVQKLIDREITWEDTQWSWTSDFHITYAISKSWSIYALAKQINLNTLSLGLGIQLSF